MKLYTLRSDALTLQISDMGAEMQSLKTKEGLELLWQGDPSFWARRAPNLFPLVGRLKNDTLRHQGKTYTLPQHGFARDLSFQTVSSNDTHCTLRLQDTAQTRTTYPFGFELDLTHRLTSNGVEITYLVRNPEKTDLLCSVGTHPGFAWPLSPAAEKNQHQIIFEKDEPAPIRRLKDGLIEKETVRTPVAGRELALSDELFIQGALMFDQLQSRSLSFQAPGAPTIRMDFPDFPHLGIWSKLGSPFLCIEPWQGFHSPEDFDGEFQDKPGVVAIAAGQERQWKYQITVES
ncbi:MAG: aldose 1-epimerase family protein [Pseudobdellovibrionaceae bacterium]